MQVAERDRENAKRFEGRVLYTVSVVFSFIRRTRYPSMFSINPVKDSEPRPETSCQDRRHKKLR